MKRTPIKRRTAMPPRKKPMRAKKRRGLVKRAVDWLFGESGDSEAARRDVEVYGPYHDWMKTHRCIVARKATYAGHWHVCKGRVTGHHVKTVGAGGKDYANEVPVCVVAHDAIHWSAEKFEWRYGINLQAEALQYAKLWDARHAA